MHRLRHGADDEAVVADGEGGQAGGGIGFSPAVGEVEEWGKWHGLFK
jgi:hypothetical protein